jgi:hypothetical protein
VVAEEEELLRTLIQEHQAEAAVAEEERHTLPQEHLVEAAAAVVVGEVERPS